MSQITPLAKNATIFNFLNQIEQVGIMVLQHCARLI